MTANIQMLRLIDGQWQSKHTNVQQICQDRDSITGCAVISISVDLELSAQDQSDLASAFGVSPCSWQQQYREATGYFLAQETRLTSGRTDSYITSFRFLIKSLASDSPKSSDLNQNVKYDWIGIKIWTQWKPSHSAVLLCAIGDKDRTNIWNSICETLQNDGPTLSTMQPFGWHALLIPHITNAFDQSVWSCRDVIRHLEQNRPDARSLRPHYASMHDAARHAIHIVETLKMAIVVLDNMMQEVRNYGQSQSQLEPDVEDDCSKTLRYLRCQMTLLECSHGRSQALTSRLQNEINLAFHIGAERDSAIAAHMARSMQRDSAAMKTISVLGLVFLPGTFVSAIFGMSFFDFSSAHANEWMSSHFWIYWAVTIPVTAVTILIWHIWQRKTVSD